MLKSVKGAAAYNVPKDIRKQSWAKKRRKKVKGVPDDYKLIYKK